MMRLDDWRVSIFGVSIPIFPKRATACMYPADDDVLLDAEEPENPDRIPWKDWLFSPRGRMSRASYFTLMAPLVLLQAQPILSKGLRNSNGLGRTFFNEIWLSNADWLMPWQAVFRVINPFAWFDLSVFHALPSLCLGALVVIWSIKRSNDTNSNPWWLLISFVPWLGTIFFLILMLAQAGSPGRNQHGPPERFRRLLRPDNEDEAEFLGSL